MSPVPTFLHCTVTFGAAWGGGMDLNCHCLSTHPGVPTAHLASVGLPCREAGARSSAHGVPRRGQICVCQQAPVRWSTESPLPATPPPLSLSHHWNVFYSKARDKLHTDFNSGAVIAQLFGTDTKADITQHCSESSVSLHRLNQPLATPADGRQGCKTI